MSIHLNINLSYRRNDVTQEELLGKNKMTATGG